MTTFRPICFGRDQARVSKFIAHQFTGYLPLNVGLPTVSATGNRILAINDVNNDKLDDLITSNSDGSVITVYYWVAETQ